MEIAAVSQVEDEPVPLADVEIGRNPPPRPARAGRSRCRSRRPPRARSRISRSALLARQSQNQQRRDDERGDDDETAGVERLVAIEEAEAHAVIHHERKIEDRPLGPDMLAGIGGEEAQNPPFAELIG